MSDHLLTPTRRCCPRCQHRGIDKGRATDGRRAYRCQSCGDTWSEGRNGKLRYSPQRQGYQFADSRRVKEESR